jgi:hypothetical protein
MTVPDKDGTAKVHEMFLRYWNVSESLDFEKYVACIA